MLNLLFPLLNKNPLLSALTFHCGRGLNAQHADKAVRSRGWVAKAMTALGDAHH